MNEDYFYETIFTKHFGSEINIRNIYPVAGGCINKASNVATNAGPFFIKVNSADMLDLFLKEERGLKILKEKSEIRTPKVHGSGFADGKSYLILEWIEKGLQNSSFWSNFGVQLARQHRQTSSHCGLDHHNHIGRLHQSNHQHQDWDQFFILERLQPQLVLAEEHGRVDSSIRTGFEKIFNKLSQLIPKEPPSLLHGDLWSGNFLCGPKSRTFIFDPAVYFGHRETEIAFTRLFGGFEPHFYTAYSEEFALESGFEDRIEIHNLYPLLVHVNLFGSSYLSGIRNTLAKFN
ncbi:MAG: fructosamine kinase family protein [Cyclobacteriaceae bacterium]